MSDTSQQANETAPRSLRDPQLWALFVLLAILFGGAFYYAYHRQDGHDGVVITSREGEGRRPPGGSVRGDSDATIAVHVAGAVRRPGVYYLPRASRVQDALREAGGPTERADLSGVNPAAPLEDADQVLVPEVRDAAASTRPEAPGPPERPRRGSVASQRSDKLRNPREGTVNINTASVGELQRLPGVGPAIAARIVSYREEVGRFTSVDQLMDVSGIGEKKLAAMRPFVRLR